MSKAIELLTSAQEQASAIRPKVGGFPVYAEVLRLAGVQYNYWFLPSLQSFYLTVNGPVVNQGTPLLSGLSDIPPFNKNAIIQAIRKDQAGNSTFSEFLQEIWQAGVVQYEVDFLKRKVTYFSTDNKKYTESYVKVRIVKRPA